MVAPRRQDLPAFGLPATPFSAFAEATARQARNAARLDSPSPRPPRGPSFAAASLRSLLPTKSDQF